MPGGIQQSLNFLTSYLKEENDRLDREVKEKSLDVFLNKASGMFKTLEADATTDDARERYYQALGMAGSLNVGREAVPFLNQMLSSSVAFIKENEAKRFDEGFRRNLNKTLGYAFGSDITGDDAAKLVQMDMSTLKMDEGYYNEQGQLSTKVYKYGPSGYREVQSMMKDPRTDTDRLKLLESQEKIKSKFDKSGPRFSSQVPNLTTFVGQVTNQDGKDIKVPLSYANGGFFYQDPATGKLNSYTGEFFDQKTASTTERNTTKAAWNETLDRSNQEYKRMASSLTTELSQLGVPNIVLKNIMSGKAIEGNEEYLYQHRQEFYDKIANSSLTPDNKIAARQTIENFVIAYEEHAKNIKDFNEWTKSEGTKQNEKERAKQKEEQELEAKTVSYIDSVLKNPKIDKRGYDAITKEIYSMGFAGGKSAYGLWSMPDGGLSPIQKKQLVSKIKKYMKN